MRRKPANSAQIEARIAALAAKRHGVLSGSQLTAAGRSASGIKRRVDAGRLHRLHRGVFAVGHSGLSFEGRRLAAALACGDMAVVSQVSAAALWRMLSPHPGLIEITISTQNGREPRDGIRLHRSRLVSSDVARRQGIPVTGPRPTLRDLHRTVSRRAYLHAVRRALDLRLISEADLRAESERSRSQLERRFISLRSRHRLPTPQVNAYVGGFEVDFLWVDHALVVETDSFRFHGHRVAFESDRARDAALQAIGYRVLRFTWRQVEDRPREVVGPLRAVMGL